MDQQKIYFPNLNGLRFIAAFLVVIHHIEQFKSLLGIENYWDIVPFIGIIGKLGVVLFFVLSGFLITYLLLAEEHTFKTINIKKFYIRRILRIWPLYFLIVVLAFLVLPNIGLFTIPYFGKDVIYHKLMLKLILYALFFPNLAVSLLGFVPYVSHTWSIGTEEQYYLVWPLILKYFVKHRIFLMVFIIAFYILIAEFLKSGAIDFLPYSTDKTLWKTFSIDCMAIGGIYAILLFNKNKILQVLLNKYLFYATIILVCGLMYKAVYIPHIHYEFYSVLFGIIILNFAANNQINISLENSVLNYLGNISYGIYMYHPIGIVLALSISKLIHWQTNWFIYPLSFMVTVLLAGLSYRYFEKYFLKYKLKFTRIISGNETKLPARH